MCRKGTSCKLLFANDLALIAESEKELQGKWQNWQENMTKKGLKANTQKTEVLVSSKEKTRANILNKESNTVLKQVGQFKYLGDMLSEDGGTEVAVRAKATKCGLNRGRC